MDPPEKCQSRPSLHNCRNIPVHDVTIPAGMNAKNIPARLHMTEDTVHKSSQQPACYNDTGTQVSEGKHEEPQNEASIFPREMELSTKTADCRSSLQDEQNACIKLLVEGCVQSFVDLFELTNISSSEALDCSGDGSAGAKVVTLDTRAASAAGTISLPGIDDPTPWTESELQCMIQTMTEAENLLWDGERHRALKMYHELSRFLHSKGNVTMTQVYQWRCIDIAREMEANLEVAAVLGEMGDVYGSQNQWTKACGAYESSLKICEELGCEMNSNQQMTADSLATVYDKLAGDKMEDCQFEEARRLYGEALRYAKACSNKSAEWRALHSLGQVHCKLGDYEEAIRIHRKCLDLSRGTQDDECGNITRSALAKALEASGETQEAVKLLEELLEISAKMQHQITQASAGLSLGAIYIQQGDVIRAMDMLDKYFELATVIGASDRVEGARIMLGTSRATCRLDQYKELVIGSLQGLLLWKSNRVLETCEPERGFPSDRHARSVSSSSISMEARASEDNYG